MRGKFGQERRPAQKDMNRALLRWVAQSSSLKTTVKSHLSASSSVTAHALVAASSSMEALVMAICPGPRQPVGQFFRQIVPSHSQPELRILVVIRSLAFSPRVADVLARTFCFSVGRTQVMVLYLGAFARTLAASRATDLKKIPHSHGSKNSGAWKKRWH